MKCVRNRKRIIDWNRADFHRYLLCDLGMMFTKEFWNFRCNEYLDESLSKLKIFHYLLLFLLQDFLEAKNFSFSEWKTFWTCMKSRNESFVIHYYKAFPCIESHLTGLLSDRETREHVSQSVFCFRNTSALPCFLLLSK